VGKALISMNELHVESRSHLIGISQSPRPTQPSHPFGVDKMSISGGHIQGRNGVIYDKVGPTSKTASVLALRS